MLMVASPSAPLSSTGTIRCLLPLCVSCCHSRPAPLPQERARRIACGGYWVRFYRWRRLGPRKRRCATAACPLGLLGLLGLLALLQRDLEAEGGIVAVPVRVVGVPDVVYLQWRGEESEMRGWEVSGERGGRHTCKQ
jgi:hypothetical protein